jgi:small subunit ribosomal protein S21
VEETQCVYSYGFGYYTARFRYRKSLSGKALVERTFAGMIKVKARGNESLDQMLRRFKKMCEKEGLTKEIKRTSYYEKPSERRRRRLRKSQKRELRPGLPAPSRSR